MVFSCQRKIFLRDTDATGVIYFGSTLQYAQEAFELFLHSCQSSLPGLFSLGYFFPIVHVEADYKTPLKVGDELTILVKVTSLTERSFTVEAEMLKATVCACTVKMVHTFLKQGDTKASRIPEEVRTILRQLLV